MIYKLNKLCSYITEKVNINELKKSNYISTENMLPNKNGIKDSEILPNTEYVKKYSKNDVLISNIRPYFKKIWFAKNKGGCSNDVLVFRAKVECFPNFLYYLLSENKFFDYATATSKGTKMPRGDKKAIMEYEIPDISLDNQIKIAGILKTLDDKILLNNQINDNLEQQAKTIFLNNFININYIPNGWYKGNLFDIANYLNGLAMQKFRPTKDEIGLPVLKIKELRQGSCDTSSELCSTTINPEYIVRDGDIIFSWSGTLLVKIWGGDTCGLNQHLFKVTSDMYDKWFYYLWTVHHLNRFIAIAADKATTMGHIKREDLAKAEVLIPSKSDYKKFSNIMDPIFETITSNMIENRKLSTLRNSLLPKLMSGKIDVSKIEI